MPTNPCETPSWRQSLCAKCWRLNRSSTRKRPLRRTNPQSILRQSNFAEEFLESRIGTQRIKFWVSLCIQNEQVVTFIFAVKYLETLFPLVKLAAIEDFIIGGRGPWQKFPKAGRSAEKCLFALCIEDFG